jgi:hypothetical protein
MSRRRPIATDRRILVGGLHPHWYGAVAIGVAWFAFMAFLALYPENTDSAAASSERSARFWG